MEQAYDSLEKSSRSRGGSRAGLGLKILLPLSALILLVACKAEVTTLNVSPRNIGLTVKGATAKIKVECFDKNGAVVEEPKLEWTSSDPAIVSVDTTGKVTAVGSGKARISVKAGEVGQDIPVTASLASKLEIPHSQVTLTPELPTARIEPKVLDEKGQEWTGKAVFKWTSTDPKVATVEDGLVTSVAKGSTLIKVSFQDQEREIAVTSSGAPAPGALSGAAAGDSSEKAKAGTDGAGGSTR